MKILMLNWRDLKNPRSGGAEVLTEGILHKLSARHDITLFASTFPHAPSEETTNGYRVIRAGGPLTVRLHAWRWWRRMGKDQSFDVVVDQVHGLPFFAPLYIREAKIVAFIHEVAGSIWFKMYSLPVAVLGRFLEMVTFKVYRHFNTKFITVSSSTKHDLAKHGIAEKNIIVTSEAIEDEFFQSETDNFPKEPDPTLIYVGRLAAMKQVDQVIRAFNLVKQKMPNAKLWIVGGGEERYVESLKALAGTKDIVFWGKVSVEKKKELMAKAWILVSGSIKEGFGLVVIEAAALYTAAVTYNVPGFRDSVKHDITGILCEENSSESMAESIIRLIEDPERLRTMQVVARSHAQKFTFDNAANEFEKIISII